MATVYDTLRSPDPADFVAAAACVESQDGSDASAADAGSPPPDAAYFYLVRGAYGCAKGTGPLGSRSDGAPRTARSCP